MKPIQWTYRVKNVFFSFVHTAFPRYSKRFYELKCPDNYNLAFLHGEPIEWFNKEYNGNHGMFSASDMLGGKFTFLNRSKHFDTEIAWQNKEFSYLWDFNLHYFEYLLPIAKIEGKVAEAKVSSLLNNWIQENSCPVSPAWHPYTTSLRIINWVKLLLYYPKYGTQEILRSLYTQLAFLECNLEGHLLVNHIWENARALIFGGVFFRSSSADRWYAKGVNLLKNELSEEILPLGGHFERSPMYHSILLEGLFDTLQLLRWANKSENWIKPTTLKMCEWLEMIRTPDDNFPLFNDSATGISAKPSEILNNANRIINFPNNLRKNNIIDIDGLVVMDAGQFKCFIDGADIGPSYNPGHAHADNLTYELFFQKQPLVVDTGTPTYEINNVRQMSKSTREHNTVLINDLEQSELWGGFRAARRSNPDFNQVGSHEKYLIFAGEYTNRGYPDLGISHERHIISHRDKWILVWDKVLAKGELKSKSFCKLHPQWEVINKGDRFDLQNEAGDTLFLYPIMVENSSIIPSFYYPEFGSSHQTRKLFFTKDGEHHLEFGYLISVNQLLLSDVSVSSTKSRISFKLDGNFIDFSYESISN